MYPSAKSTCDEIAKFPRPSYTLEGNKDPERVNGTVSTVENQRNERFLGEIVFRVGPCLDSNLNVKDIQDICGHGRSLIIEPER